jgi:hypothetical protein
LGIGEYAVVLDAGGSIGREDGSQAVIADAADESDAAERAADAATDARSDAGCNVGAGAGCYPCAPTTPAQFLSACTSATCVPFDDMQRLTKLSADGALPPLPPILTDDSGAP